MNVMLIDFKAEWKKFNVTGYFLLHFINDNILKKKCQ